MFTIPRKTAEGIPAYLVSARKTSVCLLALSCLSAVGLPVTAAEIVNRTSCTPPTQGGLSGTCGGTTTIKAQAGETINDYINIAGLIPAIAYMQSPAPAGLTIASPFATSDKLSFKWVVPSGTASGTYTVPVNLSCDPSGYSCMPATGGSIVLIVGAATTPPAPPSAYPCVLVKGGNYLGNDQCTAVCTGNSYEASVVRTSASVTQFWTHTGGPVSSAPTTNPAGCSGNCNGRSIRASSLNYINSLPSCAASPPTTPPATPPATSCDCSALTNEDAGISGVFPNAYYGDIPVGNVTWTFFDATQTYLGKTGPACRGSYKNYAYTDDNGQSYPAEMRSVVVGCGGGASPPPAPPTCTIASYNITSCVTGKCGGGTRNSHASSSTHPGDPSMINANGWATGKVTVNGTQYEQYVECEAPFECMKEINFQAGPAACTIEIMASRGGSENLASGSLNCSCGTSPPSNPPPPPANCTLPWGGTIAHGANVIAYGANNVACGSTCNAVTRSCNNGVLSGSGSYGSCTVSACPINGTCRSYSSYYTSQPATGTANGCMSGSFAEQSDTSGQWRWYCEGINGGTTASCGASKPKNCSTAPTSWSVGQNTCHGSIAAANHNAVVPANDTGVPTTGTAGYKCVNGAWEMQAGAVCTFSCTFTPTPDIPAPPTGSGTPPDCLAYMTKAANLDCASVCGANTKLYELWRNGDSHDKIFWQWEVGTTKCDKDKDNTLCAGIPVYYHTQSDILHLNYCN